MLAQVPATWPNKQPPDGLAEQVSDLRPETWMLVGRIGGHMGFHIGNRVEVVIAQGTEPALDGGVDGVGIGMAVGSRDRATHLISLLQGNPGTDSSHGQSAPASPTLTNDHLGDTPDRRLNSPVPRACHMPERETEQIGPGEGTGRPFGLCEIVSARMKKPVDSIELRLYQGGCLHRYSAFLNSFNNVRSTRNALVKGTTENIFCAHHVNDAGLHFSATNCLHRDAKVQMNDRSGWDLSGTLFELLAFLLSTWADVRTDGERAKLQPCRITFTLLCARYVSSSLDPWVMLYRTLPSGWEVQ